MNIAHLNIEHLKLFENFDLSFTRPDRQLYEWTVLIGENGTGKTSILQAIAMAAAGQLQVNTLASRLVSQLRDRRGDSPMKVTAAFRFSDLPRGANRPHPGLMEMFGEVDAGAAAPPAWLMSQVSLAGDETSLRGSSNYTEQWQLVPNPLDTARAKNVPLWFVAGYGVGRQLPDISDRPLLNQPSIERMMPLFHQGQALTSTAFINYFRGESGEQHDTTQPDKALMYSRMLKRALFTVDSLLPAIRDLELRGHGGVRRAGDLQERDRFRQRITDDPADDIKLPLNALSHGYQSTIAWIADLIGHIVLEAETELRLEDLRGLVLIDELDLFLHPTWQVILVNALRKTFPRMQFVATTHSPLVLAGLRPDRDQIVRLQIDPKSGNIVRVPVEADPRTMTGTELLRTYFSIDDIHPDEAGRALRDYRYLAANPFRSDADDVKLNTLRAYLATQDIDPHFEPVPRETTETT